MFGNDDVAFALLCFVSLFAMIEPIGMAPIFISLTAGMQPSEARRVAYRSTLIAVTTLFAFAVLGKWIFDLFGISVNSLRVVGGVIFFIIGYDMLQARLTRTAFETEPHADYGKDIALTPLGIPMICGPGAIANVMILWSQADGFGQRLIVLGMMGLVVFITLLGMLGAQRVSRFLGDSGNKVLLRLMGLITMVIAVEFFFSGLKPILRDILMIPGPA